MLTTLIWSTGGVIVACMALALLRFRDPLHPLMFLGPMMLFVFCLTPARIVHGALLGQAFSDVSLVVTAQAVVLASVAACCAGTLWYRPAGPRPGAGPAPQRVLDADTRRRIRAASYVMAVAALAAYLYQLDAVGGVVAAFSRAKGGGASPSGYLSEATLLSIPAVMLFVLSRRAVRVAPGELAVTAAFLLPQFTQGTLGARRGPLFLALATMGFAWFLGRARRPSLRAVTALVVAAGFGMTIVMTHRQQIFIGSTFDFSAEAIRERLLPTELNPNDTTPMTWRVIAASDQHDFHYRGRRFLVQLFVRPVPKQLWPTKYEDTRAFVGGYDGPFGLDPDMWYSALGSLPEAGTAVGFPADAFLELGWGGVAVAFLIGLLYSYTWMRGVSEVGAWTVIYLEAAAVSVYVVTQGIVSAWFYRFLLLAVPTWMLWHWASPARRPAGPRAAPPRPPRRAAPAQK